MYLPFKQALRVSFEVDRVPSGDDGKKPNEREPKFAKKRNCLEMGEAMVVHQQYTISNKRNQEDEDGYV